MLSAGMREFRQLVFTCPELRESLHDYTSDAEFIPATVALAATFGIELDENDVRMALNAGQREWIERWI